MVRLRPSLTLFAIVLGISQFAAAGEVDIRPKWSAGQSFEMQITRTIRKTKAGKIIQAGKATADVRAAILEARPSGFLIQWQTLRTSIDPMAGDGAHEAEANFKLAKLFTLQVETDPTGKPLRIRNLPKISGNVEDAAKALSNPDDTPSQKAADAKALRAVLSDEKRASKILLTDMMLALAPVGKRYAMGTAMPFQNIEILNPAGGLPFQGSGTVTLQRYEAGTGRATVGTQLQLDPDRNAAVFREMAKRQMTGSLAPTDDELNRFFRDLNFVVEARAEHVIDVNTGWPTSMRMRVVARDKNGEQMEGLWITPLAHQDRGGSTAESTANAGE